MLTASQSQKTRTLSEQEIEQLFVDHYDLLYAAAKSVTDNKHDAEDIVQTLFLKFVGQKFWPEITTNFKGYLYRVAVNEARGMIRSRNRLKEIDTGAVFVSLDRLERGGLISARPSERSEDESNLVFSVTPEGERMLREVRSAAKQLMEALNDRAPGWPPAQCDIRRGLRHRGKSRESCKSLLLFLARPVAATKLEDSAGRARSAVSGQPRAVARHGARYVNLVRRTDRLSPVLRRTPRPFSKKACYHRGHGNRDTRHV